MTSSRDDRRNRDLRRLAAAVRRVVGATVTTGVDGGELERAVVSAVALADRLDGMLDDDPWAARAHGDGWSSAKPPVPADILPVSPVIGPYNPIAPPAQLEIVNGEIHGRVRLGAAYVGPAGRAHGGWVAAVLDQVLGLASLAAGHPGMTASLTVRMRHATPLDQDLTLVGRQVGVSGRRSTVWGGIYAGDRLTAEAEGVFVLPHADSSSPPPDVRDR